MSGLAGQGRESFGGWVVAVAGPRESESTLGLEL